MIEWLEIKGYRSFEQYRLDDLTRINLIVGKNNSGKTSVLEAFFLNQGGQKRDKLAWIAEARGEAKRPQKNKLLFDVRHFCLGHARELVNITSKHHTFELQCPHEQMTVELPIPVTLDGPVFISNANLVSIEYMAEVWNKVVLSGREDEVLELMRILDDSLDGIFFLGNQNNRGDIVVGRSGMKERHPIGSQGEGLQRLLGLSLAVIDAENKLLLVDEIDTGLHYSLMPKLWIALEKAATEHNVQVFATTHSYDAIRGLAIALEEQPGLRDQISVHKLDRRLDHSVRLEADELRTAIEQEIEVR